VYNLLPDWGLFGLVINHVFPRSRSVKPEKKERKSLKKSSFQFLKAT